MTLQHRTLFALAMPLLLSVGCVGVTVFWLFPTMHTLRTRIDNNRATIATIQQQQSNLTQLSNDIDRIRSQQTDLEQHVWLFEREDDFYAALDAAVTANHLTSSTPSLADATPTSTLVTRPGLLTLTGTPTNIFAALTELQHQSRLIVIQKLALEPAVTADSVVAKINFTTLWK